MSHDTNPVERALMLVALRRCGAPRRLIDEAIDSLELAICDAGMGVAIDAMTTLINETLRRRSAEIAESN